jgi:hypothetical protein
MNQLTQKMVNRAFLKDARGGYDDDFIDIDYGGAKKTTKKKKNPSSYNIFIKHLYAMAKVLRVDINKVDVHALWCEYARIMGLQSKACALAPGISRRAGDGPNVVAHLLERYRKPILSQIPQEFMQPQIPQEFVQPSHVDLPGIQQMLEEFQRVPEQTGLDALEACENKLQAIRQVLGSGILTGGATKRRKKTSSSKKTEKRSLNPWAKFITLWSKKHKMKLGDAMRDPRARKAYCAWVGKSSKKIGFDKTGCLYKSKPTKTQKAARAKLRSCATGAKTYSALAKCRAAGILI